MPDHLVGRMQSGNRSARLAFLTRSSGARKDTLMFPAANMLSVLEAALLETTPALVVPPLSWCMKFLPKSLREPYHVSPGHEGKLEQAWVGLVPGL